MKRGQGKRQKQWNKIAILQDTVRSCTNCHLRDNTEKGPTPPHGTPYAKVLVLGEGPGLTEDRKRTPFVGKAGVALSEMLAEARFDKDHVAFGNTVSCRPPKNRTPFQTEAEACSHNVELTFRVFSPIVVIAVGSAAAQWFRQDIKITRDRGRAFHYPEWHRLVMPTLHPAFVLRNPSAREKVVQDFVDVRKYIEKGDELIPDTCRHCRQYVDYYDPYGFAYCHEHTPAREYRPTMQKSML